MIDLRVEGERNLRAPRVPLDELLGAAAPAPVTFDDDESFARPPTLRDVPLWQRDMLALSQRARRLMAPLRVRAVAVLGYFDHVRRSIAIGDRTLSIDPAGSYRLR